MSELKKISQMEPWLGKEEQRAVLAYLKSGGWLTEFKKTREFEQMIADYVGAKYCSVVSNGTVSLSIALMALGIGRDDEVIVPDYTMIASANAVVLAGAKPVLIDIDKDALGLDFEATKKAISKKTKAIMLVSINGRCPQIEKFIKLTKEKKIFLIEDAAQSLGSRYKGKHFGTFGDVGSFSFSMPKVITTGQGGCLVTNNGKLYKKILEIKDFGREKAGIDKHDVMGFNFKFTDLQAVIGIEQMKKLEWRAERKKEMYKKYHQFLESIHQVSFINTDMKNTSPWFIDILLTNKKQRDALVEFLKIRQIGTRPFYPAVHTQPPYAWVKGNFKNSQDISERGLWLPSASFLKDKEIERVCKDIKAFFNEYNS